MEDSSHLDSKYFIDPTIYNCPFCNRRHVAYSYMGVNVFDWSNTKQCTIWRVRCDSCLKTSMHLTFQELQDPHRHYSWFRDDIDLDGAIFYSVPTSFFVIDKRIPRVVRELITEAEGSAKMNFLTGASVCTRKAIYELLAFEKVPGTDYDSRIKALSQKFPAVDPELFEVLGHVKDMTSEKVHEHSWEAWDSNHLHLFLEALKSALHEMYVVPDERASRVKAVRSLRSQLSKSKAAPEASGSGENREG
jgi:transcription elongation factor Elf1